MGGGTPTGPESQVHFIGKHRVEIDGDLVTTRMIGDFTLQDMEAFYALIRGVMQDRTYYSIGDLTHGGTIKPDARRYAVEHGNELKLGASVMFGLNPAIRVIMIMLIRAARLMTLANYNAPFEFVATEAAARERVGVLRAAAAKPR